MEAQEKNAGAAKTQVRKGRSARERPGKEGFSCSSGSPLNFGWLFKRGFEEKDRAGAQGAADFEAVDLPHTNRVLPFNYIDEADYQFVDCYARQFRLPAGAAGRDVLAYFEGVMLEA